MYIGLSGIGGYEVIVVLLILFWPGLLLLCRTRLTARVPSSCHKSTMSTMKVLSTLLTSISCPVISSNVSSRMQGGGVIGLRSLSPKPHIRARMGCCSNTRLYRRLGFEIDILAAISVLVDVAWRRESVCGRGQKWRCRRTRCAAATTSCVRRNGMG